MAPLIVYTVVIFWAIASLAAESPGANPFRPEIPRVWQQAAHEQFEVPLSRPEYSPKPVSEDYYYRMLVAPIYKSYPVYAPGRAPAGYMEKLKQLKPELAFDRARLKTKQDWIRAGELVFDAPATYGTDVSLEDIADPDWYAATRIPIAKDGTIPWVRYVIRGTGNVEIGNVSCAFCHTRVLPDGTVVKGGQSNFSFDKAIALFGIEGESRPKRSEPRCSASLPFNGSPIFKPASKP